MAKRKPTQPQVPLARRAPDFARFVRDLARWGALSTLGLSAACDGLQSERASQGVPRAGNGGGSDGAGFASMGCDDDSLPRLLDGIQLGGQEPDYLAWHAQFVAVFTGDTAPQSALREERGVVCAGAGDSQACQALVREAAMASPLCTAEHECGAFFVDTLGDAVTRRDTPELLAELLGEIDTPEKAIAIAAVARLPIVCAGNHAGTGTRETGDGFEVRTEWFDCLNSRIDDVRIDVGRDGSVSTTRVVERTGMGCTVGRRPAGLVHACAPARFDAATLLVDIARLEAASIVSFERIARELDRLGAPRALVQEAARAALDEVVHARRMTALAQRLGGVVQVPVVEQAPTRDAFALALDNAVEGCVRECFGAVVAQHQAYMAADPVVRAAMADIAVDETRHGHFSWELARWLEPQLTEAQRVAVQAARMQALVDLQQELNLGLSPRDAALLGWPSPPVAAEMLRRLGRAVLG